MGLTFNPFCSFYYPLCIKLYRDLTVYRHREKEDQVDNLLEQGVVTKKVTFRKEQYSLAWSPVVTEADRVQFQEKLLEIKASGVYDAAFSSKSPVVPYLPKPANVLDVEFPKWQAIVRSFAPVLPCDASRPAYAH